MTTEQPDFRAIAGRVASHMRSVFPAGELDVVDGDDEIEIATYDWNLHFEPSWAFLAIEHEPEDSTSIAEALGNALNARVIQALAAADADLDGGLGVALTASNDPLSIALAARLSVSTSSK